MEPGDIRPEITDVEVVRLRILTPPPDPDKVRTIAEAFAWVRETGKPFAFIWFEEGTPENNKKYQAGKAMVAALETSATGGHE
jgi:hypothetical protein